jgi:hypothetical protein
MKKLSALWVLLLAAGCSGITVSTDHDTSADFSALKSWSWYPEEPPPPGSPDISPLVLSRIRASLEEELKARGYAEATRETADFLVAYRAAVHERIEAYPTTSVGYGWGPSYAVTTTSVYAYDEGTLVVDVIDRKTKNLVWRGIARKAVDRNASAEQRDANIRKAVRALLEEFPPAPRAAA